MTNIFVENARKMVEQLYKPGTAFGNKELLNAISLVGRLEAIEREKEAHHEEGETLQNSDDEFEWDD